MLIKFQSGLMPNIFIWENCKLFEEKEELYTVAASGLECSINYKYSSVIIQDKDKNDLLAENSKLKETLVNKFYYGIRNIRFKKDDFYHEYWKMKRKMKEIILFNR